MKFLKIISSSFHERGVRERSSLTGNPLGFYAHSQKYTSEEDIIELLKFHLDFEEKIEAGFTQDILIVSSNSKEFTKGEAFLNSLENKEINGGKILIMLRENVGYSFGAFNAGFQKFQDDYDFFIFQEDDLFTQIPDYLKKAIDIWDQTKNCGFVPFIASTKVGRSHRKALNIKKNEIVSCHGGHGMSSAKVLKHVTKEFGSLAHNSRDSQEYIDHLREGEIMFTYTIKLLGYEFGEIPKEIMFNAPALDIMRGIKIRKYPNTGERIIYYLELFIKKPFVEILRYLNLYK